MWKLKSRSSLMEVWSWSSLQILVSVVSLISREKGRDLTQSYDKSPYTHRKIQKATWQHKKATKNFDYTTIADRLRTVSWSNKSHPIVVFCYSKLWVPVKCETKRNETKQIETKRNKSKWNETNRNKTKQNETKQIETKRNKWYGKPLWTKIGIL